MGACGPPNPREKAPTPSPTPPPNIQVCPASSGACGSGVFFTIEAHEGLLGAAGAPSGTVGALSCNEPPAKQIQPLDC